MSLLISLLLRVVCGSREGFPNFYSFFFFLNIRRSVAQRLLQALRSGHIVCISSIHIARRSLAVRI